MLRYLDMRITCPMVVSANRREILLQGSTMECEAIVQKTLGLLHISQCMQYSTGPVFRISG